MPEALRSTGCCKECRVSSYYDRTMEVLHCKVCGTKQFMSSRAIFDQEQYVQAVERFAKQHLGCDLARELVQQSDFRPTAEDKQHRERVWSRLVNLMESAQRKRTQIHAC